MCGIAGSVAFRQPIVNAKQKVASMCHAQAHRGPDCTQVLEVEQACLGHNRLSILDLEAHANQPMTEESKRFWLVFNGEIYNFVEIREELSALSVSFQTNSDTEVLLKAWRQWREACLNKLEGMFAFAVWDNQEKTLFLARDRFGEKPLYYTSLKNSNCSEHIVFASELTALLHHPDIDTTLNHDAINQFLSLNYILDDQCMLSQTQKLAPAHYLVCRQGQAPKVYCYWQLADYFQQPKTCKSLNNSIEDWNQQFDQVVKQQLRSDVPLGAFLSGGIDSSAVSASAQRQMERKLNTYSIDFAEKSFSEACYADQVAQHIHSTQHTKTVQLNQFEQFKKALLAYDEPFADSSALPTYYLCQYAREQVTVCLSGDGADEIFAGYETYMADKLHRAVRHIPAPLLNLIQSGVKRLPTRFNKVSLDYKLKQFLKYAKLDPQQAHFSWRLILDEQQKQALCQRDFHESFNQHAFETFSQHYQEVQHCNALDQSLYVDIKTWLANDILVKVDRAAMAHSLETRIPFLNHRLVEFSAKLPAQWKLHGKEKKYFLKKAQESYLPKQILYRKKRGFNAPISHWLLDHLQQPCLDLLHSDLLKPYFNTTTIDQLWNEHQRQQQDHGLRLLGLLSLALWLERYQTIITRT